MKFRRRLEEPDFAGLRLFQKRFAPHLSIVVTRDHSRRDASRKELQIPLWAFLLAF